MRKEDVKYYNDPDGFMDGEATYPCNTQYMTYNPMLHRYHLTVEGMQHYGLDAERRYISDNPNKMQELIEKTSKKVYDYINYKAGFSRYQIMLYRIATAPKTIYPDQYFMRKQFEQALVDQAKFIIENSDSARYSQYDMDSEVPQQPLRPDDNIRDNSDMSPECMRTLESLNLTRWFNAGRFSKPDLSKY